MATVIGNPDGDVATVEVIVTDQDGNPYPGERVRLSESGTATPSEVTGETGTDGRIIFHEGTGPPPCNPFNISLPDREQSTNAGCFNNGDSGEVSFTIQQVEPPVIDPGNGGDNRSEVKRTAIVGAAGLLGAIGFVAARELDHL